MGGNGRLSFDSAVNDYMFRGEELECYNVYDFVKNTYEQAPRLSGRGIKYLDSHPQSKSMVRYIRAIGHNCIAEFRGRYPPRSDIPDQRDMYCASMLTLLKPWRRWEDLKRETETWEDAFQRFKDTASERILRIIANIQYKYHCEDVGTADRDDTMYSGGLEHERELAQAMALEDNEEETERQPTGIWKNLPC